MALIEPMPHSLRNALNADGSGLAGNSGDGHAPVIAVRTDFLLEGIYGEEWLVVTQNRLRVFKFSNGQASLGRKTLRRAKAAEPTYANNGSVPTARLDIALTGITAAKVEPFVGGGALEATIDGQTREVLRYSNARQRVFRRVSKYLDDLAKHRKASAEGEKKEAPQIEEDKDPEKRCPQCGLPLPAGTSVCPACVNKARVLARLLRYLIPYRRQVAVITLMLISGTGLGLVSPYLTRPLMDVVLVPKGVPRPVSDRVFWLGMIVGGMLLSRSLSVAINITQGRTAAWLTHQLAHTLRLQLYQHLQRLSLRFYDKRQVGAIMSRVTQDTSDLESVLSVGAQFVITPLVTLVGIVVILCSMNWRLFLCVIIPVPVIVLIAQATKPWVWRAWSRWRHLRSRLHAVINDNLSGVRVVKAFAQEDREIDRFTPNSLKLARAGIVAEAGWMTVYPFLTFVTGLGTLVVWYVGGRSILSGNLTVGTLISFAAYVGMLYMPIDAMNRLPQWFADAMVSAERVFDILDTAPEVADQADAVRMERIEGRVVFDNVTFGYDPNKPVLHEVSLDVAAGEMIGLVGHSGAGKSTTINLLCRFYDPVGGRLLIDGVDARNIAQKDLRSQIGLVLQDTFLFNGTIADNIGYAKPGAALDEIMAAAKAANAHDFIAAKPDGYDAPVGDRGTLLSGGERQRIAIARAILHNPRILILDEATSAVDTDTEKQIQDAIARLIKGRTTFAIAHRLSTLRHADRLVVLKAGKIQEIGSHEELMAKKGEFFRLVEMQQEMSKIHAVAR